MADRDARRGSASSPYSRTGLFPWGSTYEVPVRRDGQRVLSHTPCHLRPMAIADVDQVHHVRCPACGRAWTVMVALEPKPQATWTA